MDCVIAFRAIPAFFLGSGDIGQLGLLQGRNSL